ncbi:MAG: hypothetical protein HYT64_01305 [Candidatus Yanofskybacteria bacterium]|nr:hypothetical protein [Candidatus Yanofskybacteria bacterium]
MNKSERPPLSFEENIKERINLWESIVNDSNLPGDIKDGFLGVIRSRFAKKALPGE